MYKRSQKPFLKWSLDVWKKCSQYTSTWQYKLSPHQDTTDLCWDSCSGEERKNYSNCRRGVKKRGPYTLLVGTDPLETK